MKKKNSQMSSSLAVGILLALAGGFMDAYSYMARGHVFANAQTGNILLFAVAISEGRPADSLRYLLPVVSFALGIALAAAMRTCFGHMSRLHWRQLTLLVEILILFGVSFFPAGQHLWANSLTSLACGIQVQAFRKIEGNGIATTMCIGNLRAGVQALHEYHIAHDREELRGALFRRHPLFCAGGRGRQSGRGPLGAFRHPVGLPAAGAAPFDDALQA